MKRLLLSGLFLFSVVAAYAHPRPIANISSPAQLKTGPSGIRMDSSPLNDTIYFGGTRWAADSMRWEAIKDSVWTFDTGVGSFIKESGKTYPSVDPYKPDGFHGGMEGWTGWDWTYNPVYFFRRLSALDPRWKGASCVGNGAGLGGDYSFWVGVLPAEAESLCFAAGKGYGNVWHVCIEHSFDYAGGDVTLSFLYSVDAEPDYDYAFAFCDTGGTTPVPVVSYTGLQSGAANLPLRKGEELPVGPKPIKLQFCFDSDAAWSDEDGLQPTNCGAFAVDNIALSGGMSYFADFENSDDGWKLSSPEPGLGGDWSNLVALADLPPPENLTGCAFRDSVLVFFDPASAAHPPYQNNVAISPWIDFDRAGVEAGPGYFIDLDGYFDLPLRNYIFVATDVQWFPDTCSTTGQAQVSPWRTNGFVYEFGGYPTCRLKKPLTIDFSNVIPKNIKELRFTVGVVNYCRFFANCTGTSNSSPWFDNLRVGTVHYRTLQSAIDQASSGDTLWIPPGTYSGNGNVDLTFGGKHIFLKSTAGAPNTIIDGEEKKRGIICNAGDSAVVAGITFNRCVAPQDQGYYLDGGAVYIGSQAAMRFEDCVFTQCAARSGGGIYLARDSRQYLLNCTFLRNLQGAGAWTESPSTTFVIHCEFDSNATAGAVFNGAAHVEDCVFSGNQSGGLQLGYSGSVIGCEFLNNGGTGLDFGSCGQFACSSTVQVRNCTSSGNHSSYSGGGIAGYGGAIDSCRVSGNSSFSGGGIFLSRTRCKRTTVENNEAQWGGGIYMMGGTLDSCLIRGNWAGNGGGGVLASTELYFTGRAPVDLDACTITGNKTNGRGGGVYFYDTNTEGPGHLVRTTLAANKAQEGGGAYGGGAFSAYRSIFWGNEADSSGSEVFLAEPDTTSVFNCSAIDSYGVARNGHAVYEGPQVFSNPLFCRPALARNAPTSEGDYTVSFESPCLPGRSPCDSLIGALGEGCDVVSVLPPPTPEEPPFLKIPGIHAGPNPFIQTLTIHYLSPNGTDPRLEIYSIDGRLIGKWALRPGSGVVSWDGRDPIGKPVASGIYLVRYIAGDLHVVRRVVRLTR